MSVRVSHCICVNVGEHVWVCVHTCITLSYQTVALGQSGLGGPVCAELGPWWLSEGVVSFGLNAQEWGLVLPWGRRAREATEHPEHPSAGSRLPGGRRRRGKNHGG